MSDSDDSVFYGVSSPPHLDATSCSYPYNQGATFVASRHQPPAPFGGSYLYDQEPSKEDLERMAQLKGKTQLEWCLTHLPVEGTTNLDDTLRFTIQSTIRTGESCGAQLILTTTGVVAKIYDPLFYPFQDFDCPEMNVDVVANADSDYSSEVAAYSELQGTHLQGSIMPEYYGAWTINVTSTIQDMQITRPVRMLLMEHIPGIPMLDIRPNTLTPEERENIMIKVMEADCDLRYAGVCHDDLSPRNIMITMPSRLASPDLRLVLVDFAHSFVFRLGNMGLPLYEHRNPLFEWSWPTKWSSYGWTPPCGEESAKRLWDLFGNGRNGKYVKVQRDHTSRRAYPIGHWNCRK